MSDKIDYPKNMREFTLFLLIPMVLFTFCLVVLGLVKTDLSILIYLTVAIIAFIYEINKEYFNDIGFTIFYILGLVENIFSFPLKILNLADRIILLLIIFIPTIFLLLHGLNGIIIIGSIVLFILLTIFYSIFYYKGLIAESFMKFILGVKNISKSTKEYYVYNIEYIKRPSLGIFNIISCSVQTGRGQIYDLVEEMKSITNGVILTVFALLAIIKLFYNQLEDPLNIFFIPNVYTISTYQAILVFASILYLGLSTTIIFNFLIGIDEKDTLIRDIASGLKYIGTKNKILVIIAQYFLFYPLLAQEITLPFILSIGIIETPIPLEIVTILFILIFDNLFFLVLFSLLYPYVFYKKELSKYLVGKTIKVPKEIYQQLINNKLQQVKERKKERIEIIKSKKIESEQENMILGWKLKMYKRVIKPIYFIPGSLLIFACYILITTNGYFINNLIYILISIFGVFLIHQSEPKNNIIFNHYLRKLS